MIIPVAALGLAVLIIVIRLHNRSVRTQFGSSLFLTLELENQVRMQKLLPGGRRRNLRAIRCSSSTDTNRLWDYLVDAPELHIHSRSKQYIQIPSKGRTAMYTVSCEYFREPYCVSKVIVVNKDRHHGHVAKRSSPVKAPAEEGRQPCPDISSATCETYGGYCDRGQGVFPRILAPIAPAAVSPSKHLAAS